MSDVPCSNYLLDEIDSLLNEDTDDREVTISQGILRKCCWHLYQYQRLTARVEALEGGLTQIAASRDMTLLGCSPDNEYPDCSADEEKAHQYGAVKAFNQCADIADATLAATEQEKGDE